MPNVATVTDILSRLIEIPSVSPMGRDLTGPEYFEERLSAWLMQFFESLNVECECIEVVPGRSNVVARYYAPDSSATLLMDAHQDTVPVDGMIIPPFDPRIDNGRLYGRGATDVKGGMAAMLFAFRRLITERPPQSCNVIMSCTCDEEATTLGVTDLVSYWREPGRSRLVTSRPDAALIAEPTLLDVVVAHRGAVRFKIHAHGRACHSSDPSQGINAIHRMSQVVQCLDEYAMQLKREIAPHPLCGGPTLNVGLISGGSSVNIVPDTCTIELDRRIVPGEGHQQVWQGVQDYLSQRLEFPVTCEKPYLCGPALGDDDNGWLASQLLSTIQQVVGSRNAIGVPFGTHASRTYAGGVPSIVFGPGSIEQAHTDDEFIEIDQLEKAAEVYFQFAAGGLELPSA